MRARFSDALRRRQRSGGDAGRRCAARRARRDSRCSPAAAPAATARADLIALLREICDERSRTDVRRRAARSASCWKPAASPIPAPIVEAIRTDPILVHHIVVSEIVVAVDALHGARAVAQRAARPPAGRDRRPADRHQGRCGGGRGRSRGCWRRCDAINPGAAISGAVKGSDVPLPPFDGAEPEPLPDLAGDAGGRRSSRRGSRSTRRSTGRPSASGCRRCSMRAATTCCASRAWCARRPDGCCCRACARSCSRPRSCPSRPKMAAGEDNTIVVIGRGYRAEDLGRSLGISRDWPG